MAGSREKASVFGKGAKSVEEHPVGVLNLALIEVPVPFHQTGIHGRAVLLGYFILLSLCEGEGQKSHKRYKT